MKLSLIAAMTDQGVIGLNNRLPWHLPEDLKHFKKLTSGHAVIMGRKTFDSMGKPLPGRTNIVVSRNPAFHPEGCQVVQDFEGALREALKVDPNPFIIGGSEIFRLALPKTSDLYLTLIHKDLEGDKYFPKLSLEEDFEILSRQDFQSAGPDSIPYTILHAKRK